MIRVCCVCKLVLGEKEPLEDKSETHTYCPEHEAMIRAEIKEMKQRLKEVNA